LGDGEILLREKVAAGRALLPAKPTVIFVEKPIARPVTPRARPEA
jgi:hypothetical protein